MKLNLSGDTPSDSNVFAEQAIVYRVPSGSRPGHYHYTIVPEDGEIVCTCEGYMYRSKCKHVNRAQELTRDGT